MRRVLVALAVAALFGISIPAAHAFEIPPANKTTTTSQMNGSVRKLIVGGDSGDVVVKAGDSTTVKRTEHWVYARPRVKISFSDGVLTVRTSCPNYPLNNCWVDVETTISRTATVQVKTDNGNVAVNGIGGTGVAATVSNGDIRLSNLTADMIKAMSSNGNVAASLRRAPADTTLKTDNGNIAATVPRGTYALDVGVSYGAVNTTGVTNDRASAHRLSAHTINGNITIAGR